MPNITLLYLQDNRRKKELVAIIDNPNLIGEFVVKSANLCYPALNPLIQYTSIYEVINKNRPDINTGIYYYTDILPLNVMIGGL